MHTKNACVDRVNKAPMNGALWRSYLAGTRAGSLASGKNHPSAPPPSIAMEILGLIRGHRLVKSNVGSQSLKSKLNVESRKFSPLNFS